MGVLDKFLDAIKLNDDYDDDDFFDDELDDEFEDEKPRKKFFDKFGKKDDFDDFEDEEPEPKHKVAATKSTAVKSTAKPVVKPAAKAAKPSKITPMRSNNKKNSNASMEVCVIKPTSMEDTREIADTLVDNCTVVLNLEGIDVEVAQRIVDFTSGACYSLGGSLQKISSYIFILTPYNVDISGDFQDILNGAIPSIRTQY